MKRVFVPPGTQIAVMRHGESAENEVAGKGGPGYGLNDLQKLDASLSRMGMVQGFMAAKTLQARGFVPDVIAHSNYRRAKQTMEMLLFADSQLKPRCIIETESLDEQRHWQAVLAFDKSQERRIMEEAMRLSGDFKDFLERYPVYTQQSGFLFLAHLFSELNKLTGRGKMPKGKGEIKPQPPICALHKMFDEAVISMLSFNIEQKVLPRIERRKRPDAEKLLDVVKRLVIMLWRLDELVRPPYNFRSFLFITHSKVCVAAFLAFGGMHVQTVEKVLKSEGPPFPPNASITFYREKNGVLAGDGKYNRIPPFFYPEGRLLELVSSSKTRIAIHEEMVQKGCPALFNSSPYFTQPGRNSGLHHAFAKTMGNIGKHLEPAV